MDRAIPRTRWIALSLIASGHLALLAGIAGMDRMREVFRDAQALQVTLIPPEAPRREVSTPSPIAPRIRMVDIRPPEPPRVDEIANLRFEERPVQALVAPPAPTPAPMITAAAPSPSMPAAVPPRADLAYLQNPAPAYPATSRRAGEQGRVLLRVRVDADGRAEHLEIEQSSGFVRLDEAAIAAVRRWRFAPARLGERAVAGMALVPVRFSLHG